MHKLDTLTTSRTVADEEGERDNHIIIIHRRVV